MDQGRATKSKEPREESVYRQCMIQLRERLDCVEWLVGTARFVKGDHFFVTELIFLQLRKALELIALSSMAAHKVQYSAANAKFREHWKARAILASLSKINPGFYPKPVRLMKVGKSARGKGQYHYGVAADGTLSQADFDHLYDASSAVLHTQNPYSDRPNEIDIGRTVPEWVMLIRNLVRDHVILMGNTAFLVQVPDRGEVTVHRATANDQPPFSTVPET